MSTMKAISVCFITAAIVAGACMAVAAKDDSPPKMSRERMRAMYKQNQRLEPEIATLQTELSAARKAVAHSQENIDNYKYVIAENEKFLARLAQDAPGKRRTPK